MGGETGFDWPSSFTLGTTINEQQELSGKLIAKPLRGIIGEPAYAKLRAGNAERKVSDKDFAPFFNPETKVREYYQEDNTLIVKEDIYAAEGVGEVKNKRIFLVAVFEKSSETNRKNPATVTFTDGKKTPYLQLKNLCLVKEENDEAVDLAQPWLSQEADVSKKRRIGLLPYQTKLSKERMIEAIVATNNILITDTQDETSWNMHGALGVEDIPSVPRWIGNFLAAAKSTQKERDITKLNYLLRVDSAEKQVKETLFHYLPHFITGKLPLVEKFFVEKLIRSVKYPRPIDMEKIGVNELIRLERNAVASTLMAVRQLRKLGFDLFPGRTNHQLIQELEGVLHQFDERYATPRETSYRFASEEDLNIFIEEWRRKYLSERNKPSFSDELFAEEFVDAYKTGASVSFILRKLHLAQARGVSPQEITLLAANNVAHIESVANTDTPDQQVKLLKAVLVEISMIEAKKELGIKSDMTARQPLTPELLSVQQRKLHDNINYLAVWWTNDTDNAAWEAILDKKTKDVIYNLFLQIRNEQG